jgi:hypothetical protein
MLNQLFTLDLRIVKSTSHRQEDKLTIALKITIGKDCC